METSPKSETLSRLKALVNAHVADPNVRLEIIFAAIDYGAERSDAALDRMSDAWQCSIDRRAAEPLRLVVGTYAPPEDAR